MKKRVYALTVHVPVRTGEAGFKTINDRREFLTIMGVNALKDLARSKRCLKVLETGVKLAALTGEHATHKGDLSYGHYYTRGYDYMIKLRFIFVGQDYIFNIQREMHVKDPIISDALMCLGKRLDTREGIQYVINNSDLTIEWI
ncbi:hypothetical protein SM030_00077 [Vibrio phage vB_VpaS_sm030]|nr:hypothetical protein SM030_00077 [Vibrio phage vB_VpaS_sm030]CAI5930238.1 hypothetical protein SM031_00077 [Vibrio phage vB_VpaS_sm030]CAI6013139.1 hypothetical protein SM032_00077 [Vibrio phage vB_VpaS_sm030]